MKEQIIQLPDNFEVKEIKDGKIILVEKEKKLTYEDIAKELFCDKDTLYISNRGRIEASSCSIHIYCDSNNCISEKQAEKLLAINKLMNVAKYLNDGWQPDWNDALEFKYYLLIEGYKINIACVVSICCSDIYFKSKKLAEQAVNILGKETIRLALCTDY